MKLNEKLGIIYIALFVIAFIFAIFLPKISTYVFLTMAIVGIINFRAFGKYKKYALAANILIIIIDIVTIIIRIFKFRIYICRKRRLNV